MFRIAPQFWDIVYICTKYIHGHARVYMCVKCTSGGYACVCLVTCVCVRQLSKRIFVVLRLRNEYRVQRGSRRDWALDDFPLRAQGKVMPKFLAAGFARLRPRFSRADTPEIDTRGRKHFEDRYGARELWPRSDSQ